MFKNKLYTIWILIFISIFSCTTTSSHDQEIQQKVDDKSVLEDFFKTPTSQMRIAVLPISNDSFNPSELEAIRLEIEEKLIYIQNYKLIDNKNVTEIMEYQDENLSGLYSEEYAIQVAKLIFANNIVYSSISKINSTYQFNIKQINVESGEIIAAKNIYFSSIQELVNKINPEIKIESFDNQVFNIQNDNYIKENDQDVIPSQNVGIESPNLGANINIQFKTITIDGRSTDWNEINPIELSAYDGNKYLNKLYISQDKDFLYFRVDLFDDIKFVESFYGVGINLQYTKAGDALQFGHQYQGKIIHRPLNQYLVTDSDYSGWKFNDFPRGYSEYKDIFEFKIKKEWFENITSLKVNTYITEYDTETLYWSEDFYIEL